MKSKKFFNKPLNLPKWSAVHMIGTLSAVVFTGNTDPDQCAKWLYEEKEHICSVEQMKDIVLKCLPELVQDGMIVDGVPTEDAQELVSIHQMMMRQTENLH